MEKEKVRLTQMVTSAGCAAKIFPDILHEALKGVKWKTNEHVLVGFDGKDDAGVYKINDELALIHTTDFFTPVVDDPYTFGQIAATNSLSDVYAMGGIPINALNILAFPQKEDVSIIKEILSGGADKADEAGTVIIGGHSVDIPSILYGMAVTGTINPNIIKRNDSVKAGDLLILTKGLGTGILNNKLKFGSMDDKIYRSLIGSMTRLNKNASIAMQRAAANGCTDITGFGLAGHSMQMAIASKTALVIYVNDLPVLEGAMDAIKENFLTRGDKSNKNYTKDNVVTVGELNTELEHLLYDPQTSGGLLISVPEDYANNLLHLLHDGGDEAAKVIGSVEEPNNEIKPGSVIFDYSHS